LFIDPDPAQILAAVDSGAPVIEIHTGAYANAREPAAVQRELERIETAAALASAQGLVVNAGHGLHYQNIGPVVALDVAREFNIGHAIVARALFVGLGRAVEEMKACTSGPRG